MHQCKTAAQHGQGRQRAAPRQAHQRLAAQRRQHHGHRAFYFVSNAQAYCTGGPRGKAWAPVRSIAAYLPQKQRRRRRPDRECVSIRHAGLEVYRRKQRIQRQKSKRCLCTECAAQVSECTHGSHCKAEMAQAHHACVPLAAEAQHRKHTKEQRQQKEDAAVVGPVVQIPLILLGKRRAFPLLGI